MDSQQNKTSQEFTAAAWLTGPAPTGKSNSTYPARDHSCVLTIASGSRLHLSCQVAMLFWLGFPPKKKRETHGAPVGLPVEPHNGGDSKTLRWLPMGPWERGGIEAKAKGVQRKLASSSRCVKDEHTPTQIYIYIIYIYILTSCCLFSCWFMNNINLPCPLSCRHVSLCSSLVLQVSRQ